MLMYINVLVYDWRFVRISQAIKKVTFIKYDSLVGAGRYQRPVAYFLAYGLIIDMLASKAAFMR